MPRRPHQPEELLSALPFLGWWAVDEGLLTVDQLRSSAWRKVFRGVYVHQGVPDSHELRARAACVLLPRAVVSGASAAVMWDVDLAGTEDDVEVTLPAGVHPVRMPGLRARRAWLPREQRTLLRATPVTTPEATAVRLAGLLPGDEAVVAVDRILATRAARLDDVRALAGSATGRGSARARRACSLADGVAGSPQETKLRLLIHRSGLPLPLAQHRVFDDRGRFVARVDFGWPEHRVAVEYDGLWHADAQQFPKDRQRLNRLGAAGWRVVFVTAADLHDPERLLRRIAAALCG